MHLVQILLPVYDNAGAAFPPTAFHPVRDELMERFGGLTAYTRAPALGLWDDDGGAPRRDDIVVYEVMDEAMERGWWAGYRVALERRFAQEEIVIRAHEAERL